MEGGVSRKEVGHYDLYFDTDLSRMVCGAFLLHCPIDIDKDIQNIVFGRVASCFSSADFYK